MSESTWWLLIVTTAAPSLTAVSAPSPQISLQVSLDVVDPPVQVHPVSAFHARFYMKSNWIFQLSTWKTAKGFPNRPIGIPSDVRSAPDDVIWTEVYGDGKRFNSISTYCNDRNLANGDGSQGWCSYSIS